MKNLLFREIRWFLPGPVPGETWDWFRQLLPGDMADYAYPRQDVYLIVPQRADLGLKAREGRFEIKIRPDAAVQRNLSDGKVAGMLENWTKNTWDYAESISEMATPFRGGPRVRVIKARNQRKYEFKEDGRLEPAPVGEYPPVAVAIEVTELYSERVTTEKDDAGKPVEKKGPTTRHWTVACEAIGPPNQVNRAFDEGAKTLLESYAGPRLTAKLSYGYPCFALSIFEVS